MTAGYGLSARAVDGRGNLYKGGIAEDTCVLTSKGSVHLGDVRRNDIVITRRGPRRVLDIELDVLSTNTGTVCVTPKAFPDITCDELVVAPRQRLVLRDWRARLLFGRDVATPPASRLVDDEFIRYETSRPVRMVSLYFGQPEVIYAAGLEMTSSDAPPELRLQAALSTRSFGAGQRHCAIDSRG